jgi:hypothetical protein
MNGIITLLMTYKMTDELCTSSFRISSKVDYEKKKREKEKGQRKGRANPPIPRRCGKEERTACLFEEGNWELGTGLAVLYSALF